MRGIEATAKATAKQKRLLQSSSLAVRGIEDIVKAAAKQKRLPQSSSFFATEDPTRGAIKTCAARHHGGTFGRRPGPKKTVKRPQQPSAEQDRLHRVMMVFVAAAYKHNQPVREFLMALDMSDGVWDYSIDVEHLNGGLEEFGIALTRAEVDLLLNHLEVGDSGGFAVDEITKLVEMAKSRLLTKGGSVYARAMKILKSRQAEVAVENNRRASEETLLGAQDRQALWDLTSSMYARAVSFCDIFVLAGAKEVRGAIPRRLFLDAVRKLGVVSRRQCCGIVAWVDSRQTGHIDFTRLVQCVEGALSLSLSLATGSCPGARRLRLSAEDAGYCAAVAKAKAVANEGRDRVGRTQHTPGHPDLGQ
jgi:Ca2+-binding EF-hand superfamily protein